MKSNISSNFPLWSNPAGVVASWPAGPIQPWKTGLGTGAVVRHGGRAEGRPRLLNRHHHRLLRARSPDDPRVCAEGAAVCSCREHSTAHAAGWPRWAEAQGGLQDGLALLE